MSPKLEKLEFSNFAPPLVHALHILQWKIIWYVPRLIVRRTMAKSSSVMLLTDDKS